MTQNSIRIAAVQANPTVGDLVGNLETVRRMRARFRGKADLVVFTECFVTGYPLGDLVLRKGFLRDTRRALEGLAREIEGDGGPAVLVGAPRDGGPAAYNAAFLIDTDGTMQVSDKHRLPNTEVYDERRTFAEGKVPVPLRFRGFSLGVLVCEDFWHRDVPRALAEEGAEFFVVLNGSHFRVGKQKVRLDLARDVAQALDRATLYTNQYCGQDELVFDGGSFAMDRHGGVLAQVGFREAAFLVEAVRDGRGVDLRLDSDAIFGGETLRYPEDELEQTYLAMVTGLRDYVNKCGFPGVVLGMSGGLDSALSAAVAVDALGPDRVLLVRMPSDYTSNASNSDAVEAAAMLGARIEAVPISGAVDAYRAALAPLFSAFGKEAEDVTEENIQARVRGTTLMALSNKLGLMVVTTGNKSEMSVGFATLYGDMCGGYSVLKDLYKTAAFEISRWRNARRPQGCLGPDGPVMPVAIIDKPPSAELKPGQTDEGALGTYRQLDSILRHMVEGLNGPARAAELASAELGEEVTADYAARIGKLVWRAQYKREQAPPGVVLTARNFGKGWRLPVVNAYGI